MATQTVTILFCDLVGSTELLTRLGDDANDRVRRDFFAAMREQIAAHGGVEAVSQSAITLADHLDAAAVVTLTESGFTARSMSKYRPRCPILRAPARRSDPQSLGR